MRPAISGVIECPSCHTRYRESRWLQCVDALFPLLLVLGVLACVSFGIVAFLVCMLGMLFLLILLVFFFFRCNLFIAQEDRDSGPPGENR
ncbi:MAG: hypothetical protein LBO00_00300 [Zoogloeaceae bacterium]|jgi:Ca2+/Na+ antiporter|nr:hypothetical protein [Zoogloeaceae bacterium]